MVYIHIPFCIRKCNYCAFLSGPASDEIKEQYVEALIREIRCKENFTSIACSDEQGCKENFTSKLCTETVYFGGGTPSLLSESQLERILKALKEKYVIAPDAEITLEANPGTLGNTDEEILNRLKAYRSLGINRLSMGVQSMNDEVLAFIGRIHTSEDVRRDFRLAREAGFDNISLDLILSLPVDRRNRGETALSSRTQSVSDLEELIKMRPEHVSCYGLQIEDGTPFAKMYDEGLLDEISDEEDREIYHEVCRILSAAGYEHYEISNFALTDCADGNNRPAGFDRPDGIRSQWRSKHNSGYWNMSDYAGFGLGASGFENGIRYRNTTDMKSYLTDPLAKDEVHINTETDNIGEAVFTGLRRCEGIRYDELPEPVNSEEKFRYHFRNEREEALGFVHSGHLVMDDRGMRLTESGIDISNRIMALFV